MAWHHDPDAGVSDPCLALLDEMDMLVRSIVGFPTGEGGDHATILEAFGEFLMRFGSDQIPWVRLYEIFPAWQQRSRLLQQDWDEVAVQGANLVLTLVNPLPGGAFFSRKARGGGTWKSTGGDTIGKKVVLSKLYCRRGGYRNGFTAFEFRLSTDVQPRPRVALCVLHRTDYRHCAWDLRQYAHQGWFPGRIQANPQVVPQIYQDPYVAGAGIITGPLVDYANNRASNSGNSYGQPSIHSSWEVPPPCASLHEQLLNLLLLSANNSMTEISRYNRLGGMQANIPSSTYSVNDSMRYMPCETNMLAGQHSHVDEMSTQNYDYNNSTGNINHYANPPIQDAMTNYNEPLLEPLPLWEGNPTATTDDHAQDGH